MKWMFLLPAVLLGLAAEARAELPSGLKFDDGFTFVEARNYENYDTKPPSGEWVPVINVRVLGSDVHERSGWRFVFKKKGKALAEYTTDGYAVRLARGPVVGLNLVGFWRDQPRIREDGAIDLDVYFIDGKTDKEHLAKTLKLDVQKVATERGSVGQRDPGPPQFVINRHAEVLSTILYFRDAEYPSYTQVAREYYSDRVVELVLNYATTSAAETPALGRIRVEVDGQEVDLKVPGNDVMQDGLGGGELAGSYNVEHSDRAADKYFKGGPAYRERVGFARRALVLPLHWGPKPAHQPPSKVFTNDHPGQWKVTWLIDRKPARVWRFKVGADGLPVPHAEQAAGLTLLPNAVLAETEIPKEGAQFDGRLTNKYVKTGAFYGRPWATPAMKKLADQVPAKFTPFPVPSNKQKPAN
jgi:hypothetical protein